ncbi:hypothetical protein VDS40_03490, partial [Xanthomonas campestris pv. campestris]|nr:hypothetical protein [Xanthomonas campestris pv. campestris]
KSAESALFFFVWILNRRIAHHRQARFVGAALAATGRYRQTLSRPKAAPTGSQRTCHSVA